MYHQLFMRVVHYIFSLLLCLTFYQCTSSFRRCLNGSNNVQIVLEDDLFQTHNVASLRKLQLMYVNGDVSSEDMSRYTTFAIDSMQYLPAYLWVSPQEYGYDYYRTIAGAYFNDGFAIEIYEDIGLKKELVDFYTILTFKCSQQWEYSAEDDMKKKNKVDSLICMVLANRDSHAYEEFRRLAPMKYILPIATFAADSMEVATAMYDVFRYMCFSNRETFTPMNSEQFRQAYHYLSKGVEHDFSPCIWRKSLLLLTGVYLPQDTIEGKRLLEQCIENPPCTKPFWRKPD